jgi:hypothetical protein
MPARPGRSLISPRSYGESGAPVAEIAEPAIERAHRTRWPHRVRARLQDGPRRHRVEAQGASPPPARARKRPVFLRLALDRSAGELADAARSVGRPITFQNASTDAEIDAAFATLGQQRVAALLVTSDPFFDTRRDQIIALSARQRLPAIYHFREYAMAGGLMS